MPHWTKWIWNCSVTWWNLNLRGTNFTLWFANHLAVVCAVERAALRVSSIYRVGCGRLRGDVPGQTVSVSHGRVCEREQQHVVTVRATGPPRHAALTLTKLAGNQPSSLSIWPHHQSLLDASSTLMTSPALKANSRSAMVTWSHTASALTMDPALISCKRGGGEKREERSREERR